jgi:aquaporin Z
MSAAVRALREHWPEYLMEAWGLAIVMLVSAAITVIAETSLPPAWLGGLRRIIEGVVIAGTVVALIYSPWGRRSGAHYNPAVTLTFFALGRVTGLDAVFYAVFQVGGGILGILIAGFLLGSPVREPPVMWIVTRPGQQGAVVAFIAELTISFVLMSTVLVTGGLSTVSRFTGVFVGALIFLYICFEAPLSGFSMNPARSFASAAVSGSWHAFWIYALAPPAGMLAAALLNRSFAALPCLGCAKLIHDSASRCIHCGFVPERKRHAR